MELEKQIVSLELAKRMKEMGFEQESAWYWVKEYENDATGYYLQLDTPSWRDTDDIFDFVSAYTVAELGEMSKGLGGTWFDSEVNKWFWNLDKEIGNKSRTADTEANARAKMLIYLNAHTQV